MSAPRTRLVHAAVAAAVLVVAGVAINTAPPSNAWLEPLPVAGTIGQEAVGRNLAATVHGVRLAETIVDGAGSSDEIVPTGGVWVVVDLSARAIIDERVAGFNGIALHTAGLEYSASDRVDGALNRRSLSIAVETTGSIAFELPEVPDAPVELHLALRRDSRGDSVLVVPISLDGLEPEASVALEEITQEAP